MLSDTPIPTFPRQGGGAHRWPELSPIQASPHFKDVAPLVLLDEDNKSSFGKLTVTLDGELGLRISVD